jgi:hypothetical protein
MSCSTCGSLHRSASASAARATAEFVRLSAIASSGYSLSWARMAQGSLIRDIIKDLDTDNALKLLAEVYLSQPACQGRNHV